jgi:two-component system sensor histidine kinase MprB
VTAWWRRRTLHARLSLLVTGAVAAAVVALAVASWLVVAEIQHHRLQSELTADAQAIAAQPDQWLAAPATLPGSTGDRRDGHRGPRQLGPRWQILDASATVIGEAANPLPVTAEARQAYRDVYLCGPPRMADAVRSSLRDAGLPAENLHEERFAF